MGYNIREKRLEKGMTQDELSKESDISRATISGLESGRVGVTTTETLIKIAEALGCDVEEIFFTKEV